jgi:hypothetical protein
VKIDVDVTGQGRRITTSGMRFSWWKGGKGNAMVCVYSVVVGGEA